MTKLIQQLSFSSSNYYENAALEPLNDVSKKNLFEVKYREWLEGFVKIPTSLADKENLDSEFEQESSTRAGRPEKSFDSCSEHSKRAKVRHLVDNVSVNELTYAAQMATRASGSRISADIIKSVSESPESGKNLLTTKQKFDNQKHFSAEEALALYVDNKFTSRIYKNIRKQTLAKGHLLYPSYYVLQRAKKDCFPQPDAVTIDDISARVNLQELLNLTVKRLIEVLKPVIKDNLCDLSKLTLLGKWGADGCSAQSLYKQKFKDPSNTDEFLFMISYVPIKLFVTNDPTRVIWQNRSCSSTRLCRPITFIYAKETRELVLNEIDNIKQQIENLKSVELFVTDRKIDINFELVLTMIDGKITNILTDNRDSQRCYLCGARADQLNFIGQDRPLKTEFFTYGLSTLHAWIRFLEFSLKISYNIDVAKRTKEKKDDNDKFLIETRKTLVQQRFKSEMGLNIDKVMPGYGTSNDGNTARTFFKHYKKSAEITGVDEQLLKLFSIILSVMSSGYTINYVSFQELLEETKILYKSLYDWCNLTPTVHKILFHGVEVIKQSVVPIGQLSEEAQEARNKDFRRFRLSNTRKSSRENTNNDVLNMLFITSDPVIDSFRERPIKNIKSFSPEILKHLVQPQVSLSSEISSNVVNLDSSFENNYLLSDSTDISDSDSD